MLLKSINIIIGNYFQLYLVRHLVVYIVLELTAQCEIQVRYIIYDILKPYYTHLIYIPMQLHL